MKNTEFAIIWFHPFTRNGIVMLSLCIRENERSLFMYSICTRSRLSMTSMERIWNAHSAHQFVNVHNKKKSRIDFLHFLFISLFSFLCYLHHSTLARISRAASQRSHVATCRYSAVRLQCLTESYIRGIRRWFCRHDYYYFFFLVAFLLWMLEASATDYCARVEGTDACSCCVLIFICICLSQLHLIVLISIIYIHGKMENDKKIESNSP